MYSVEKVIIHCLVSYLQNTTSSIAIEERVVMLSQAQQPGGVDIRILFLFAQPHQFDPTVNLKVRFFFLFLLSFFSLMCLFACGFTISVSCIRGQSVTIFSMGMYLLLCVEYG